MDHKRSITVTAMRRPELFRQLLESLVANDLAGWQVIIRVEPSERSGEFAAIAEDVLASIEYDLSVNQRVRGITLNPFLTIEEAFAAGSRLNLYLEEDLLVAPDATALALWYEREHKPTWLCLSLLAGPCGSTGFLSNERHPGLLFAARTFNSIGFVIRREEWYAHARAAWIGDQRRRPREFTRTGVTIGAGIGRCMAWSGRTRHCDRFSQCWRERPTPVGRVARTSRRSSMTLLSVSWRSTFLGTLITV